VRAVAVAEFTRTVGAFAYFESDPATQAGIARATLEVILRPVTAPHIGVKMSVYKGRQEGRWRGFKWQAIDDAIADPDVQVLNLVVGAPSDVWFSAKLQLRSSPDLRLRPPSPRCFYFASEQRASGSSLLAVTGKEMLEQIAGAVNPVSGGVLAAPRFNQACCEVEDSANSQHEPSAYIERNKVDCLATSDRWTKARRLYPITLLGPKLASQVTAADALAAGALAVQEINGSLLIDSYPTVVETWDPEYLKATVNLRKWLWPHTIQNPADAVGLGLKLPKR
jgi:hypothetical protein